MNSPEALLSAYTTNKDEQARLITLASEGVSRWEAWLCPFASGQDTGEEPVSEDNFQSMRDEINKLSGTDPDTLCLLAEQLLCEQAKDIRVVTWYILARLLRDGENGLAEGVLLLAGMLSRYGRRCYPLRPHARKAALEWLNSARVLDTLSLWPEADRAVLGEIAGAMTLLSTAVAEWPEDEKPSFSGLCSALAHRLTSPGEAGHFPSRDHAVSDVGRESVPGAVPRLSEVKSGRDFIDQARLLSRWLGEQPEGWLAAHRLMKVIRWDTVDQIPPADSSGRTRLTALKPEYRAQLKRLYLQKNWVELTDQASQMFTESANNFCLDLQWSLWQGLRHAGPPWESWSDAVIQDLRLFLTRIPGLELLTCDDGTPFADEVTAGWIAEKVFEKDRVSGDGPAGTLPPRGDDMLSLEAEAMQRGDSEGPEAALAWLQTCPGRDTPRERWLVRLLMARIAEQYGRHDVALPLLGELTGSALRLTLAEWEPGLLFEVRARRLKLLRLKASRNEGDSARLIPEMDDLLAGLIALDPARAMALCG